MRTVRRLTSWTAQLGLVLAMALAAGCASGGGGAADEGPAAAPGETLLEIHNTDSAGQPLRVYLAREAGQERLLGTVQPEDYLRVPHTEGQGRFLFRAERPDGTTISSSVFNVVSGTYSWDIALRRVERKR